MKFSKQRSVGSLLLLTLSWLAMPSAHAVGTASGTTIQNQATVSYSVGAVPQTNVTSNVAQFIVDSRIDFNVTRTNPSGPPITARPNELNVVATFTVNNTGNSLQSYQLIAADPTGLTVFGNAESAPLEGALNLVTAWDANNDGDYDAGEDANGTGDIAADTSRRVFILADIPATAVNGQFASIRLTARAATAGSNGATLANEDNVPDVAMGTPQVVWADAGEDNSESIDNQYAIISATLSAVKTATVIRDDFNGTTDPKAIPGATVEYQIEIANGGAAPAQDVGLTDTLAATTQIATGAYSGEDIQISVSGGGPTTTCTVAADADGCSVAAGVLTVAGADRPTIPAGQTATVRFQVTIL
jgi:uncharacterized repeat protein (TIGR01451 family)